MSDPAPSCVFRPKHLALLRRVLDQLCFSHDPALTGSRRDELAAELFALFGAGERDERALLRAVSETARAAGEARAA